MKPLLIILLMGSCIMSKLFAQQSAVISGRVIDSAKTPIPAASVVLLNAKTGQVKQFSIADSDGRFAIKAVLAEGLYKMEINALHYSRYTDSFLIDNQAIQVNKTIVLKRSGQLLQEVVVTATPTIKEKGDTTEYDAASFMDPSVKKLEDLLKRLPGVEVDDQGTVKFKGREIEKVLVEGDDLFDKNYGLITRNFTAGAINKIQAIDHYIDNPVLKGIVSSDKVVLNLRLSGSFKSKWSGDLAVGAANAGFYTTSNTLFNISHRLKTVLIGNAANTGKSVNEGEDYLYQPPDHVQQGIGQNFQPMEPVVPPLKINRFLQSHLQMGALSTIYKVAKKIRVKNQLSLLNDNSRANNQLFEQYFFSPSVNWQLLQQQQSRQKQFSLYGKLEADMALKDSATVKYTLNYQTNRNRNQGISTFSLAFADSLQEMAKAYGGTVESNLSIVKRLSPTAALQLHYNYYQFNKNENALITSSRYYTFFQEDSSFRQLLNGANTVEKHHRLSLELTKKAKRHTFTITATQHQQRNNLFTNVELANTNTIKTPKGNYQQMVAAVANNSTVVLGDEYELKKMRFRLSASFSNLQFSILNKLDGQGYKRNCLFFNPSASWMFRVRRNHQLIFMYTRQGTAPGYAQLLPAYFMKSNAAFEKGASQFTPVYSNRVGINYIYVNIFRLVEVSGGVFYTRADKQYLAFFGLQPSLAVYELFPFSGNRLYDGYFNLGKLINPLKLNVRLRVFKNTQFYYSAVNSSKEIENRLNSTGSGIALNSSFKGFFNYNLQAEYRRLQGATNNNTGKGIIDSWKVYSTLKFQVSKSVFTLIKSEWYRFNNASAALFIDGQINYSPNIEHLSIGLNVHNLLNTRIYQERNVTPLQEQIQTYNVLPFYSMLIIRWSF